MNQVAYIIKVSGQPVGPKYSSHHLAETALYQLTPTQQSVAEIVTVQRDSGKELLLG